MTGLGRVQRLPDIAGGHAAADGDRPPDPGCLALRTRRRVSKLEPVMPRIRAHRLPPGAAVSCATGPITGAVVDIGADLYVG